MQTAPPLGTPPSLTQLKNSNQAVWSLVLGILSNTCIWILGSIPAIILGILAIKKINRAPDQLGGKGLAIAGIATGGAGVIIGIVPWAFLASIFVPAATSMNTNAQLVKQSSDVRQLILACKSYAADNSGLYPETLEILVEEDYLFDDGERSILETIDTETGGSSSYLYRPGLTDTSPNTPIIIAPSALGIRRVVGYSSGVVDVLSESEFEESVEMDWFDP